MTAASEKRDPRVAEVGQRMLAECARKWGGARVVIGASLGGILALERIFRALPESFDLPVVVCLHVGAGMQVSVASGFDLNSSLRGVEAEPGALPVGGQIYFAPPGYHLLIERDGSFALSVDEKVQFARPSIDVLFESAAAAWGRALVGLILTGANADGADGLRCVKEGGGLAVVQSPVEARCPVMPEAAIAAAQPQLVLSLEGVGTLLTALSKPDQATSSQGEELI